MIKHSRSKSTIISKTYESNKNHHIGLMRLPSLKTQYILKPTGKSYQPKEEPIKKINSQLKVFFQSDIREKRDLGQLKKIMDR